MERVKYNGTIKPNLATNSAARSFIVSVDPNSNNAVSWDRGYHFNDANARGPVHSNGLTSSKVSSSGLNNTLYNEGGWNATHYNSWTLNELASVQIDPYDYYGTTWDPVRSVDLSIYPGSSSSVVYVGPGYAGPSLGSHREYFLQPAGNPGAPWAHRAFTATPFYGPSLLNPSPSVLFPNDVSPVIPKSPLWFSSLSFPDSISSSLMTIRTVSSYTVASGYTVSNVSLSPFRMLLAVINKQGNWEYCYIPLHVKYNSGADLTFKKNPNNYGNFELKDHLDFSAHLDRECLRTCQTYLRAGIASGSFDGSTKRYFPMLSWEPNWKFSYVSSGGTGYASLGNAVFRVTWSIYKYDQSKYQVSNIEQIR